MAIEKKLRAETGEDLEIKITGSVARVCITREGKRVCGVFDKTELNNTLKGLDFQITTTTTSHAGKRRYGVYWVGERVGSHETRKEAEEEIEEKILKGKGLSADYEIALESFQGKFIRTLKQAEIDEYTISQLDAKYPNSQIFNNEKKAIEFAKKENRQIYTQVDADMDRVYLKGRHFVNRTGIYAVV